MNVFGKAAAMWNDKKPNTDEEKQQMRELREQFLAKFESLLHAGTTERFEELWVLIQAEYVDTPLPGYIQREWMTCKGGIRLFPQ
jgi:hypothetical protein